MILDFKTGHCSNVGTTHVGYNDTQRWTALLNVVILITEE